MRTVESSFKESVKVKFNLANRQMPLLSVRVPRSSFNNTGGLCGRWDGNQQRDLYHLDQDGNEEFFQLNDLDKAKDFWK